MVRLYRRLGRWNDLTRLLWDEVNPDKAPCQKLEALVELAKLEEHWWRDHLAAEGLTRQALALVEVMALRGRAPTMLFLRREALEHRLWRLRRRLAGQVSAGQLEGRVGFEPTTPGLKVRDPLTPQDNARFGQLGL